MSSPVTRFKVDRINEEPASSTLLADRDWIERLGLGGIAGKIEAPLGFALEMHRSVNDVFVSGRVEGRLSLPCYRCLKRVAEPFAGSFRVAYLPKPENFEDGAEGNREHVEPGESVPVDLEGDDEDVFRDEGPVSSHLAQHFALLDCIQPDRSTLDCRNGRLQPHDEHDDRKKREGSHPDENELPALSLGRKFVS